MTMLPAPRPNSEISLLPRVTPQDLYDALIHEARCENTRLAREWDVRVFSEFLRVPDGRTACAFLISQGRGEAYAVAMSFRAHMIKNRAAPKTVNRRLATVRRVVALARKLALIEWALEIQDLRVVLVRDVRGPELDQWRQLWDRFVAAGDSPLARRDRALIRVIHDSALRKFESLAIDFPEDLDLAGSLARIPSKGSGGGKDWITLSAPSVRFIREYLESRGLEPGPLFISRCCHDARADTELDSRIAKLRSQGLTWTAVAAALNAEGRKTDSGLPWNDDRAQQQFAAVEKRTPPVRMCEREVARILKRASDECGFTRHVRPHGLRHQAITRALDLNGGDVRRVQRFARHVKVETTLRYDDSRCDYACDITRQLGDDV